MKKSKMMEMEESPEKESEKGESKEHEDHEVEMAMQDIIRAHKHKKSKSLMAAVHKKMGEHQEAVGSIDDLKEARNKAFKKDPQ